MITIVLVYILIKIQAAPWAYFPLAIHVMWSAIKFFDDKE